MNIAIVGGGISGMTVAKGLINSGHDAMVFERANEVRGVGAGIGLWPTALACLRSLGLGAAMRDSIVVRGFEFRTTAGRCLARADMADWLRRMSEPLSFIERGSLLRGLTDALPAGALRLGREAQSVRASGGGVVIEFSDGSSHVSDLAVVAGGFGPRAIEGVHAARGPRYSGTTCWRGTCSGAGIVPDRLCTILAGSGQRFGINPLPGGRVYWWATRRVRPGGGVKEQRAELLRDFGRWGSGVPALIESTPPHALRRDDLFDADESGWGDDRIVAIGDAAHPILPTLGMAGTIAIEDAWVLADEMDRGPGLARRLRRRRAARVDRLRRLSRIASRMGHATGGVAAVRDAAPMALPDRCVFRPAVSLQREGVRL